MCVATEYKKMSRRAARRILVRMPEGHEKPTLTRTKPQCKCATPRCRNKRKPDRKLCSKCNSRKWRQSKPITAAYHNLKTHAKERRIDFFLTIEEFTKFCNETNYHVLKGRNPDSVTVDRIHADGPYSYENIRPLDHHSNSIRQDAPYNPDDPPYIPPAPDDDKPF